MHNEKTLGMLSRLFFSMLPVQILIFAMESINSMV